MRVLFPFMGHRNPDRVPLSYRRSRCETVAEMLREHWDVISKCRSCGLMMPVDLALVARVKSAKTSLWNRTQRCKRIGCSGVVDFLAKAPGMVMHEPLAGEWREKPTTEGERRSKPRG